VYKNKVDGSWTLISGTILGDGLYILPMQDNLTLQTCATGYQCNQQDVGGFPSQYPYDPNSDYFEALQIILEDLIVTTTPDDDGGTTTTNEKPLSTCFVATAAYETPLAPNVQFLRLLRDRTLKKTRSGELLFEKFFEKYSAFAPNIVEMMMKDEPTKELVKLAFVNPIINYFRIVSQMPYESTEQLKEPWKSFFLEMQNEYEKWVKEVLSSAGLELDRNLWYDFSGLSVESIIEELTTAIFYLFRSENSRGEYLDNLERLKQIPLQVSESGKVDITNKLSEMGLSRMSIKRITG